MLDTLPPIDFYPHNLLLAVKGKRSLQLPTALTKDVLSGLRYALSTLDPQAQELLRLRYQDEKSIAMAAECLALPEAQARELERSALDALHRPYRWKFIQYGIEGCLKKVKQDAHNQGFLLGYQEGYQRCAQENRIDPLHKIPQSGPLDQPLEYLNLSPRVFNILDRYGHKYIRDIIPLTEEEIMRMRSLGKFAAKEVAQALQAAGIPMTDWYRFLL